VTGIAYNEGQSRLDAGPNSLVGTAEDMRLDTVALALGAVSVASAIPSSGQQNGPALLDLGYATHAGEYNATYDVLHPLASLDSY
jgi:hypothetical protein